MAAKRAAAAAERCITTAILLQVALRHHKKIAKGYVRRIHCARITYWTPQTATHLYVISVIFDSRVLDDATHGS